MSVLVRNELSTPWIFDGSRGSRQIAAGETALISDEEWNSVISAKRGPGALHNLWPSQVTSDSLRLNLDYATFGGIYEVKFIGYAVQGVLNNDPHWTIKKFDYTALAGENFVTEIQILEGVAWTDRLTLGWT